MYCPGYHSILLLLLFGFLFLLLLHLFLFLFFLLFFLFCFLLFLLLSFLLFGLLLFLLGWQDTALKDQAFLLLLLLFPFLDLGLVVFHLRIERLKKFRDVVCCHWRVQLQFVKELEGLSIMLDWLGTIAASSGLGLLGRLALLGGCEEILFVTILFLHEHSLVVFVVKHCLLFVFLLLGSILRQQTLAEFYRLLNEGDLIQMGLLIHLLYLTLQLLLPALFLICRTLSLGLRAPRLPHFSLICLVSFFLLSEIVPELVALRDFRLDLFLKFVALLDDIGQVAKLLLSLLLQGLVSLRDFCFLVTEFAHLCHNLLVLFLQ
mmetsp:Transcript_63167/g.110040  ORF Transcript_63167/g.110040 Transcript_63167/m.110040 type:complete len:319 (-) Transcript_63167:169-1125(-)